MSQSIDKEKHKIDWIIPKWPVPKNIGCVTTTRENGYSRGNFSSLNLAQHVGDDVAHVNSNREFVTEKLALHNSPSWLDQQHTNKVVELPISKHLTADAAYTTEVDVVCAVLTADCLPVLFSDRNGECVAVAHAGWRGLAAGVLENTLHAMPVRHEQMICWLGPAIGPNKFEVGAEVRQVFVDKDCSNEDAFQQKTKGKFLADIYQLAMNTIKANGVDAIYGGGYCTYTDKQRFFSYRRDTETGRMATLIWKKSN